MLIFTIFCYVRKFEIIRTYFENKEKCLFFRNYHHQLFYDIINYIFVIFAFQIRLNVFKVYDNF